MGEWSFSPDIASRILTAQDNTTRRSRFQSTYCTFPRIRSDDSRAGMHGAAENAAPWTEVIQLDRAVPVQTIGTMEDLHEAGLATRQLPAEGGKPIGS